MFGQCLGSVWVSVRECLRSVWESLGEFGRVWECLGVFGSVWECLGSVLDHCRSAAQPWFVFLRVSGGITEVDRSQLGSHSES